MAHFAKIGLNNKVMTVNVIADADCQGADGTELEDVGVEFLERLTGWPIWKKHLITHTIISIGIVMEH